MTEEELLKDKARAEGARVSYEFMKRHIADYDRSQESAKLTADGLKERGLDFSAENLERVFQELRQRGVSFMPEPVEEELPPVPGMNPQIFTMDDVNSMDKERYKKLYFGPHAAAFRARVNEIIRRAKAEEK